MQIAWNEWIFNYFSLVIYYCTGDLFLRRLGIVFELGLRGVGVELVVLILQTIYGAYHNLEKPTLQT